MSAQADFRFVTQLAEELNAGEISLPSLPDVVIKLRNLLEQEACDFDRVSRVVQVDPVLVSRLLALANSAYHNAGGDYIDSLDVAISRLGFELVRSTALSLALKQLFLAREHQDIAPYLRNVWQRSMQVAAMSFAVAKHHGRHSLETAFTCGLLHEVGKLYILTRAKAFPGFIDNAAELERVMEDWHPQIGEAIVRSWGFPETLCAAINPDQHLIQRDHGHVELVDVLLVARLLLDASGQTPPPLRSVPSCVKMDVDETTAPGIVLEYRNKLESVKQTLYGRP